MSNFGSISLVLLVLENHGSEKYGLKNHGSENHGLELYGLPYIWQIYGSDNRGSENTVWKIIIQLQKSRRDYIFFFLLPKD